ncbi:hypothetical protein [Pseudothauera nasutitermitis]|nr:hypothetical protein [Pseudothauera nasutitermitis]
MSTQNIPATPTPDWFRGSAPIWASLVNLAEAMIAKEHMRRRRLYTGLLSTAGVILLVGFGLSGAVMAQDTTPVAFHLPTAVLMMIVFVVVGGFQTLRYLEQHALDVEEERLFLQEASRALRDGLIDPAPHASSGTPAERLIRQEAWKIRKAEESARRLAPALWGTGLTSSGAGNRLR